MHMALHMCLHNRACTQRYVPTHMPMHMSMRMLAHITPPHMSRRMSIHMPMYVSVHMGEVEAVLHGSGGKRARPKSGRPNFCGASLMGCSRIGAGSCSRGGWSSRKGALVAETTGDHGNAASAPHGALGGCRFAGRRAVGLEHFSARPHREELAFAVWRAAPGQSNVTRCCWSV